MGNVVYAYKEVGQVAQTELKPDIQPNHGPQPPPRPVQL